MTEALRLAGPLADPQLLRALGLRPLVGGVALRGGLVGGRRAGIVAGDWPCLRPGRAEVPVVNVTQSPALWRYAAVMGLSVQDLPGGPVLGLQQQPRDDALWSHHDWLPDLAAEIVRDILAAPEHLAPDRIAARLPMIGVWAESRLRGAASPPSGGDLVVRRGVDDVRLLAQEQVFSGFFAVDRWDLSHRTHAGGFTPRVTREGFVMGDAVVVLPWDPARDRVLAIEQFRFAPALRRDSQPWLLEPIAGRIDAGESVEQAARREALEEADLQLGRLFPAINHYPSPGAVAEFLYLYIGIADLHDGIAGTHGLEGEAEDIRGHLLDRGRLHEMVMAGQITNGPLAMLSLWLAQRNGDLLREMTDR